MTNAARFQGFSGNTIFFLLLHPNKENENKQMALAYELDFSEDSHWQISLSVLLELSC